MFRIDRIDHVALTVEDMERSVAWYRDVLGLERRHEEVWGGVPAMMCAGETGVALFSGEGAGRKPTLRHLAFHVDRENFLRAQTDLRGRGIAFHLEDHQISHSIYFKDPDGYEIELTTYDVE